MMTNLFDLNDAIEEFLQTHRNYLLSLGGKPSEVDLDRAVVAGLRQPSGEALLEDWLHRYRVLMAFNKAQRARICARICEYAKTDLRPASSLNEELLVGEFKKLQQAILDVAFKGGEKPRDVTSLTSKALWCCYPEDVPIYDANALVALAVVARLSKTKFARHKNEGEYEYFVKQWMSTYGELKHHFTSANMVTQFGYAVRAFDRFLWHLADTTPEDSLPVD